jgi:hypothetical protein
MRADEDEDEDGDAAQARAPVAAQDDRAQRALTSYLQGRRIAEVADSLSVCETTARRWIRQGLATLAADERAAQVTQLQRAIESQRAVASAAWEAYERERQLDEALLRGELDAVRRRAIRGPRRVSGARGSGQGDARSGDDADCPPIAIEEYQRPKRSTQGARYLALALAAQREVARLQGLYARLEQPERAVSITISRRPDGPENVAPQQAEEARDDERDGR